MMTIVSSSSSSSVPSSTPSIPSINGTAAAAGAGLSPSAMAAAPSSGPLAPPRSDIGSEKKSQSSGGGGSIRRRAAAAVPPSRKPSSSSSSSAPSSSSLTAVGESGESSSVSGSDSSSSDAEVVLNRQLSLILLLRCLRSSNLSNPVSVPFLSSLRYGCGLSPAEILWLGSAYSLFTVVAEMPSGYLSDVWGRRRTLKMAFGCLSCSLGVLGLCRSEAATKGTGSGSVVLSILGTARHRKWALLLLSQLLRAIGSALFSGTDMALLYETLKRHGGGGGGGDDKDEGGKKKANKDIGKKNTDNESSGSDSSESVKERVLSIESRHVFSSAVAEASSSALGGMLAASRALGLRGTVLASAVPFGLGAAACAMLEDDRPEKKKTRAASKEQQRASDDENGREEGASASNDKEDDPKKRGADEEEEERRRRATKKDGAFGARRSSSTAAAAAAAAAPPRDRSADSALRQLRRSASSLVLPGEPGSPLRRVFPVGVAINCATYVSSTALLPLLWSGAGLPPSTFGWIVGFNRAVSAASSLSAPALKRLMVAGGRTDDAEGDGDGGGDGDEEDLATGRSLTVLVVLSASSFLVMALSASLIPRDTDTVSISASAATAATPRLLLPAALAVLSSVVLSAVRGLAWPLLGAAVNGSVRDDSLRATTLSLFAGSIKAGMVATGFVLGTLLEVEEQVASGHKGSDVENGNGGGGAAPGLRDACVLCGTLLTALAAFSGGLTARVSSWAFPPPSSTKGRGEERTGGTTWIGSDNNDDDDDNDSSSQKKKKR